MTHSTVLFMFNCTVQPIQNINGYFKTDRGHRFRLFHGDIKALLKQLFLEDWQDQWPGIKNSKLCAIKYDARPCSSSCRNYGKDETANTLGRQIHQREPTCLWNMRYCFNMSTVSRLLMLCRGYVCLQCRIPLSETMAR